MPTEEAEIWRAENMLKALGVKTEERLNRLVTTSWTSLLSSLHTYIHTSTYTSISISSFFLLFCLILQVNYFFTEKVTDAAQAFNNESKDDAEDDYEMELMLLLNSSEDVAVSNCCVCICMYL